MTSEILSSHWLITLFRDVNIFACSHRTTVIPELRSGEPVLSSVLGKIIQHTLFVFDGDFHIICRMILNDFSSGWLVRSLADSNVTLSNRP